MRFQILRRVVTAAVALMLATHINAGGTIKGTAKFVGKTPRMKAIKMAADPICATKHEIPAKTEWLVAGLNGELKNVFVYIKEGLGDRKFPVPEEPVTIDQRGCLYRPHVLGVQTGQPIEILNSDGTLHNVHGLPKKPGNDRFNEAMPAARKKITKTFNTPEVLVKIKCDVHPWMGCWVGVLDHPYYDVTDAGGSFELKDLPPGTYTVEAVQERLPPQTETLTIKGDETVTVDFLFKRPEKKKAGG